jgi:5-methylcytosine-specific restriction protein B
MPDDSDQLFFLKSATSSAEGKLTESGFLVFGGAALRREFMTSASESMIVCRNRMLAENVFEDLGDKLRLIRDYEFRSPSGAAAAVLGRASNGWLDWKDVDGRTLGEVMRVSRNGTTKMLSESKRLAIESTLEELLESGKALTKEQLESSFATFRSRFGPEVLRSVDGEALLKLMHDQGDSLVYWLEFKRGDDFDSKQFGSIAGGSAMKFRLFRRKETGRWQAGDERNRPQDVSLEDAIAIARAHRDQLLKGVQLLEELPLNATDEEYAELQDQMDEVAPDVSRLAWGHKYFSLLFPEKLDDYHSVEWQRFHLLKMLHLPVESKGRYICAGRFVAAANEVGVPICQFTTSLNEVQGSLHRYWRIGTQAGDTNVSHWSMMREQNVVAIGWKELGDLSAVKADSDSRKEFKARIQKTFPLKNAQAVGIVCSKITRFITRVNVGDVVLASQGASVLGIGRIVGEYDYNPEFEFAHQRSVEWLSLSEWQMPIAEGLRSTVCEIKRYAENILETEKRIQQVEPPPSPLPPLILRVQSVLNRKSQVILYGPPGTGKTYWAEKAANELAARARFNNRFEDLTENEKLAITGDGQKLGAVRMCCFHPAYGYEDFLEGYRPQIVNETVAFKLQDGIFKKLCQDAKAAPDQGFFLIVDEINRGDIPRIFGELLTTIEKDKRGKPIILPVSQEVFTVPANVFVIGTMNTADRSISLLDAALRRRFGFIEMMPDPTVLGTATVSQIPLGGWLRSLNERIREHVGRDARNLQIGHSYLMKAGVPLKEFAALKRAIQDDIIPLLEEYCYEDYGALANILGEDLVDADQQRIHHELFGDRQEQRLIEVLQSMFPDLARSYEFMRSDGEAQVSDEDGDDDDDEQDE